MPRYIIERTVPGLTRESSKQSARRSMAAIESMPGVRWIRSYVSAAEGKIYCEYDAPDPGGDPRARASRRAARGPDLGSLAGNQSRDVRP